MPAEPAAPLSERALRHAARRARRRRRRRLRRAGWIALGVVLLVGPLLYAMLGRFARHKEVTTLVAQAADFERQELVPDAVERLQKAIALEPANLDAVRALAETYSRFGLPAALPLWQRLARLPGASDRNTREYVRAAIDLNRLDLAEADLAHLLSRTNVPPETSVLATDFYLRQGDTTRAFEFAEAARKAEPTLADHQIRSARVLLAMPDLTRRLEGLERLAALATPTPPQRLQIYQLLREAPNPPPQETLALVGRIRATTDIPPAEDLTLSDLLLRLQPERRNELLAEAIQRHRHGSADTQARLAAWLNEIGAHDELLAAYRLEEALRQPATLPAYYEALARTDRWRELLAATATTPSIAPWLLDGFRAFAASHLELDELAREHWRRALDGVQGQPIRLRTLGNLALRLDSPNQALDAYNRLTGNPLYGIEAYRLLAHAYRKARDPLRLRKLMEEWARVSGDDPFPENAFCYLSALLGHDLERAERRAQALVQRFPASVEYRATLALVLLRRGERVAALDLLDRARADFSQAPVQARLAYAAILSANDLNDRAAAVVSEIPRANLLPHELDIVRRIASP